MKDERILKDNLDYNLSKSERYELLDAQFTIDFSRM